MKNMKLWLGLMSSELRLLFKVIIVNMLKFFSLLNNNIRFYNSILKYLKILRYFIHEIISLCIQF